jgi:hypothetical protein
MTFRAEIIYFYLTYQILRLYHIYYTSNAMNYLDKNIWDTTLYGYAVLQLVVYEDSKIFIRDYLLFIYNTRQVHMDLRSERHEQ